MFPEPSSHPSRRPVPLRPGRLGTQLHLRVPRPAPDRCGFPPQGLFRETVKLGLPSLPSFATTAVSNTRRRLPVQGLTPPVHRFRQLQRGDALGIEVERIGKQWLGPCNPQVMPLHEPTRSIDSRLYMKDRRISTR